MRRLFAPWRFKYVTNCEKRSKGLFSRIIASSDDEANLVLLRSAFCTVLMNKFPYSSGHLLILPNREVGDIDLLTIDELTEMMRLVKVCVRALKSVYGPHGFNIGMNIGEAAGAGVEEHLHLHIVPRWHADSNFMTSTADTRVIPEDLQEAFVRIRTAIQNNLD